MPKPKPKMLAKLSLGWVGKGDTPFETQMIYCPLFSFLKDMLISLKIHLLTIFMFGVLEWCLWRKDINYTGQWKL